MQIEDLANVKVRLNEHFDFAMTIFQVDVPTANGRVYPRAVIEKAIKTFNEQSLRFGCFNASHESDTDFELVALNRISHTTKFDIARSDNPNDDGQFVALITILDTPRGNVLRQYVQEKMARKYAQDPKTFMLSSCDVFLEFECLESYIIGEGSLTGEVVNDDYRIRSFHIIDKGNVPCQAM